MVRSSSTSALSSRWSLNDVANNFAVNTANYTRQTVTSALHHHAKRGDHVKRMSAAHAMHSDATLSHLHHLAAPDCSLCKPIPGDDPNASKLNRWCMPYNDYHLDRRVNEAVHRNKDSLAVDERPPFVVRHVNSALNSRWPGLSPADKLKRNGRKSPTRARPIKVKHENFERLGSGRLSRLDNYNGDYKHRPYAEGYDLSSYQSESSSRYPDDKASSRLSTAYDTVEPLSGQQSRRSTSPSGLELESIASNAELTRPRRPSRTRDVPSLGGSLRRASSIADLLDTQGSSDAISERVRHALQRDSAYERHLVHLMSKYDDERRSRGSLERLEVDLLRSNR